MKRRTYLASLAVSSTTLAGCTVLGKSPDDSQPEYRGLEKVVYEWDDLELGLRQETVRLGDTIEFEVTNTSDSDVGLGCKNPWAIQKQSESEWQHITWTKGKFYLLCLTGLSPGKSILERITLTASALEKQASEVQGTLTPGTYRFLLIGPSPYLATEFEVLEAM